MENVTKEDIIYIAGFMDGEGTIGLYHHHRKAQFRHPIITITNTSRKIIEWCHEKFGGTIRIQKKYKEHHKQAWIWGICYDRAIAFLKEIKPFLKIEEKIRRATIILNEYKLVTKRNGKYTPAEKERKLQFEERFFSG